MTPLPEPSGSPPPRRQPSAGAGTVFDLGQARCRDGSPREPIQGTGRGARAVVAEASAASAEPRVGAEKGRPLLGPSPSSRRGQRELVAVGPETLVRLVGRVDIVGPVVGGREPDLARDVIPAPA